MKIHSAVFLTFLVVSSLSAEIIEKSVTAVGQGSTRQTALFQALSNATGQAFGIELSTDTISVSTGVSVETSDESVAFFLDNLSQTVREKVATNSNNPIIGYEVLSDRQVKEGWVIQVKLIYAAFKSLGRPSSRRTVVVVGRDDRDNVLRNKVEQVLVSSRRFDVVSRRDQNLFADEKSFIRSDNADRLQIARIGGAQGADYLVIVDIISFKKGVNRETTLASNNEIVYASFFDLHFSIQIVEFTTREVKWSNNFKVSRATEDQVNDGESWISRHVDFKISSAVDVMLAAIFPIKVISVEGKMFLVNRGSQYLKGNEVLNVYSGGEALIDPQTGERLGISEHHVGSAEVVETFPKFSRLRMKTGLLRVDVDYVVRRKDQVQVTGKHLDRSSSASAEKNRVEQKKSAFLN